MKAGSWVFDLGYKYMLFAMLEKSREDTNDILLEGSGLSLRATLSI